MDSPNLRLGPAGSKDWEGYVSEDALVTRELRNGQYTKNLFVKLALFLAVALNVCLWNYSWSGSATPRHRREPSFEHLASHCADVAPVSASEFYERQKALAKALHALNASAYVAEPGANAQFFFNVSSTQWHLSERPLLLIVAPHVANGEVEAKTTVLTPSFEAMRAKLLPVPSDSINFAEWVEEANPYEIAISAIAGTGGDVYVDEAIRKFIADGLAESLPEYAVLSAPLEIRSLRERKSPAEINLLRCANERGALRRNARVRGTKIAKALSDAGLKDTFALTLFGENAALPHGSGTDKILEKEDFVLIDCGGTLHGYNSDITRTFALKDSTIPSEHLKIWFVVHAAQTAASYVARSDIFTSHVDDAARAVIAAAGYGEYFTHRLGHGIGLEDHEAPYLRGGSYDVIQSGHAFSNEPGVYIPGKIGVRLEDIFYIANNGSSIFLTDGAGGQAISPWLI